jgi:hypothetical protein
MYESSAITPTERRQMSRRSPDACNDRRAERGGSEKDAHADNERRFLSALSDQHGVRDAQRGGDRDGEGEFAAGRTGSRHRWRTRPTSPS